MDTFHSAVPEREGPSDTLGRAVFSIITPAGPPGGGPPPWTTYDCALTLSAQGCCHTHAHTHTGGCTPEGSPREGALLTAPPGLKLVTLMALGRLWGIDQPAGLAPNATDAPDEEFHVTSRVCAHLIPECKHTPYLELP